MKVYQMKLEQHASCIQVLELSHKPHSMEQFHMNQDAIKEKNLRANCMTYMRRTKMRMCTWQKKIGCPTTNSTIPNNSDTNNKEEEADLNQTDG